MFWNKNKNNNAANANITDNQLLFNSGNSQNQDSLNTEKASFDDLKIPTPEEFGLDFKENQLSEQMPNLEAPIEPMTQKSEKKGLFSNIFSPKKEKASTSDVSMPNNDELNYSQMPPLPSLDIPNIYVSNKDTITAKESNIKNERQNVINAANINNVSLSEIPAPEPLLKKETIKEKTKKMHSEEINIPEPMAYDNNDVKTTKTDVAETYDSKKVKSSPPKATLLSEHKMKVDEYINLKKDKSVHELLDEIEKELLADKKEIEEAAKKISSIERELTASKQNSKKASSRKAKTNSLKNKVKTSKKQVKSKQKTVKKLPKHLKKNLKTAKRKR